MPIIVEVPGIGNVEFPDDTSPEQMARTIRLHQPEPEQKGSAEWVKWRTFRAKDILDEAHARDPKTDDKGFLRMLWDKVNPFSITTAPGLPGGGGDQPGGGLIGKTVDGIANAAIDQGNKAVDSFNHGEYLEAAGHGMAAALPIAGPMAANFGEHTGEALGSYLGGNGNPQAVKEAVTDVGAVVVPTLAIKGVIRAAPPVGRIVARAVPKVVEKMNSRSPRPLSPEAVAKAKELGIPLSEGARSGSTFTQGVEKILGSTVAADLYENHTTAGQAGIEKGVNQLANGFGTDQFAAGQSAIDGLQQYSKQHHDAAQAGYSQIADAEAAPENQRDVVQGTKTVRTQAGSVLGPDGRPVQPGGVQEVPIIERVGLPVDTQPVRPYLQSLYNELEQEYAPSRQLADPIFHSLGQLLKGKRYVPASVMEKFLGAMKKVQREGAGRKTFLAGKIIDAMSPAVDTAVDQASGSGSLFGDSGSLSDTLRESREHWREHAETQGLLEDLSGDKTGKSGQTRAAKTLLRPADASFPMLEKVLARAPGAAEALRQALMGEIFKSAESGEFTNPSAAANKFAQIGRRTKAALFAPEQLSDTQAVLELAKRLGENPAKGGAGVLGALVKAGVILAHPVQGATALVFGRRFAKVLFNPEGAAALRTAMSGGPGAAAALAAVETLASETPNGGTPPQGTPPAPPEAPPAAAPQAAAPPEAPPAAAPQAAAPPPEQLPSGAIPASAISGTFKGIGRGIAAGLSEAPPEAPPAATAAPTPPPAPQPAAPAAKATPPPAPEPETDMFGNPIEQTPEPGTVKEMHPSEIEADPVRFQYKRDTGGKDGVGDELKGVKNYDPELGGVLSVWRDPANGKTYVVNGHHRLELAKRAGAEKVTVRYLDAADANTARTKGAIINIAEGRGTAVDAAKVFRDTGMDEKQLGEKGVSLTGKVAKDGVNLSKLSPSIFDKVVQGDLTVERGSLIGELLPVEADQHAAMAMLDRAEKGGKSLTNGQFREAIDLVRGAPKKMSAPSENGMLFGEMEADPQEESLVLEMASVSDYIRKKLQGEKRLFSAVADSGKAEALQKAGNSLVVDRNAEIADGANRHLAAYDKLKASAGPINDALRNAAKSSSPKGAPINEIRNHAYERVRAEIRKTLGEGAKEPKD